MIPETSIDSTRCNEFLDKSNEEEVILKFLTWILRSNEVEQNWKEEKREFNFGSVKLISVFVIYLAERSIRSLEIQI